jgi:hypothetical protein
MKIALVERFENKINKTDGCWLWKVSATKAGYGLFYFDGKLGLAHRFSYEFYNGPIGEGMSVLHSCDNPFCVNPEHLFLGSLKDNTQDMLKKKRFPNQNKTHCPYGHQYSGYNLYLNPKGHRVCRTCKRSRQKVAI